MSLVPFNDCRTTFDRNRSWFSNGMGNTQGVEYWAFWRNFFLSQRKRTTLPVSSLLDILSLVTGQAEIEAE